MARLEYAIETPASPVPPVLDRLPDASERTLRERWDGLERQLAEIMAWFAVAEAAEGRSEAADGTFRWLVRIIQELDQYGRALRWVITVTERDQP